MIITKTCWQAVVVTPNDGVLTSECVCVSRLTNVISGQHTTHNQTIKYKVTLEFFEFNYSWHPSQGQGSAEAEQ